MSSNPYVSSNLQTKGSRGALSAAPAATSETAATAELGLLAAYRPLLFVRPGDGKRIAVVCAGMFVAGLLELLGVGLVIPFVRVLDGSPATGNNGVAAQLGAPLTALPLLSQIAIAGGALLGAFILKNVYLAIAYNLQMRFIHAQLELFSERLLGAYLATPYEFHLQRNSVNLIRIVAQSVNDCYRIGIPALLTLMIEGITCVVLTSFLVFLEPVAVASTGVGVGLLGFIVQRRYRNVNARAGTAYRDAYASMTQWASQALAGIKDVKVAGNEEYFLARFGAAIRTQGTSLASLRIATMLPRFVLETTAVGGLVAIALVVVAQGGTRARLVALLGVLAIALVRLLPSVSRIITALSEVRYYSAIAGEVSATLDSLAKLPKDQTGNVAPMAMNESFALRSVSYRYPAAVRPSLHDVTVELRRGEAVAVVGPSGAGKTTMVDVVIGVLSPSEGAVAVDGKVLDAEGRRRWRRSIGYVPQQIYLIDDTLRRNVAFGVEDESIDEVAVWDALRAARLDDLVRELPDGLRTRVGERGVRLSGGQRQRLGIARALYFKPSLLVLDEATSALDGVTEREVVQALESLRGSCTILVIAHRLSTVKFCDRLFYLRDGLVESSGSWDELVRDSAGFRDLLAHAGI